MKTNMKKWMTGLLALSLAGSLTLPVMAQEIPAAAYQQTVQKPTAASLVKNAVDEEYSTGSGANKQTYYYYIPEISLNSAEVTQLNKQIYDSYIAYVEDAKSKISSDAESIKCGYIEYDAYIVDNILTVMIYYELNPNTLSMEYIDVYSIDLDDNSVMNDNAIRNYYGITKRKYREKAYEALGNTFCKQVIETNSNPSSYAAQDSTKSAFSDTVSDTNLNASTPFIDEDGDLCIVTTIYYPLSDLTGNEIVDLEEYKESSYYASMTSSGSATSTSTATIYSMAEDYYIFPNSDKRNLTSADIAGMSSYELQMGINEIYARHGRRFNDATIQSYFNAQSWYHGTIAPDQFNSSVFNSYENANIKFLKDNKTATNYTPIYSYYIFPNSSSRYLTYSDTSGKTDYELQMGINEIYARHGRRFDDDTVQAYFDAQSWYHGTISPSSFNENVFNDYENQNIYFLYQMKGSAPSFTPSYSGSSSSGSSSSYFFPGSDSRYLTSADVAGKTDYELMMGVNEIYARHGRLFNDSSVQNYFNQQSWYHGTVSASAFNENCFNQYEDANIKFLHDCR